VITTTVWSSPSGSAEPRKGPPTLRARRFSRLHAHIRHEERVLFPLIEASLSDAELSELVPALERARRSAAGGP
jgi:hypothetical protein